MSKKITLEVDDNFEYVGIAIACNLPDYQFVFHLNKELKTAFTHSNPFEKNSGKSEKMIFPKYEFQDDYNFIELFLMANKYNGNILFADLKNFDFVLFCKGEEMEDYVENLNAGIRKQRNVQISKVFNPNNFKDFGNFVFDLENQLGAKLP